MIDIAARATDGVNIPCAAVTRNAILDLFRSSLISLKTTFASNAVRGAVNLTCDAWQASNTDAYFAVTAHWIQEQSEGVWTLENQLIGFVRMNNSHNGVRLGQALYKIVERLGLQSKVGWVTTDNASNNRTMMAEFMRRIREGTNRRYDASKRQLGCLAHAVNLATQAFLSTQSKSKHYDPHQPDKHLESIDSDSGSRRDEIGLVRAIAVKERSSAKRKETFRTVQVRVGVQTPLQLLLDMIVRWSSTYIMLDRAEKLKLYVDTFVYEIGALEPNLEKRRKIDNLKLTTEEWDRVGLVLNVLSFADNAQHSFSSDKAPTLYRALPALEVLHKSWTVLSSKSKYVHCHAALSAGLKKLGEYYNKTADNEAYLFALILHPENKLQHFRKYWSEEAANEVIETAEGIYEERYYEMFSGGEVPSSPKKKQTQCNKLLRVVVLDDDNEEETRSDSGISTPSSEQGLHALSFKKFIESPCEEIPSHMNLVQWWGFNAHRYPVWASLARDYLSIMASSVSSERAFSQAGLTIRKHRNRLKGDIVEALQFVKCAIRNDLIFRESGPTSTAESTSGVGYEGPEGFGLEETQESDTVAIWDSYLGAEEENDDDIKNNNDFYI